MMPAWLARLSPRERRLVAIVGGVVFLLINLVVWSSLLGAVSRARADYAGKQAARKMQSTYMKEKTMWAQRDQWVKAHQPVLKNPSEASALLDEIRQIASKHNVLIENPAIGTGDANANYRSAFATVETKSPWPALVRFLYDVQQPEAFVVFESVNLAIDSGDPTQMRGKFKIARWFAPGTGGTK